MWWHQVTGSPTSTGSRTPNDTVVETSLHIALPVEWYRNGCVVGDRLDIGIYHEFHMGTCHECSHVLNGLDLWKFKSHVCKHCRLASVAGNGSWVGFGGGVWRRGKLQGELRVLSGVGGMAAGVGPCDPSGSSSSAIALLGCSVSPLLS